MPDPNHVLGLVEAYRESAELQSALAHLDGPEPRLGGFAGASLAFFLSAWKAPGSPQARGATLIVTAAQDEADETQEELETFSSLPVRAFPAWESLFLPDSVPDADIHRQRLNVLGLLAGEGGDALPLFIVAPIQALLQPVPDRRSIAGSRWVLARGAEHAPQRICEDLVRMGLRRVALVEARGEVAWRGDIVDFFPLEAESPIRVELLGDTIESIREFDSATQRSLPDSERDRAEIVRLDARSMHQPCFRGREALLSDYLGLHGRVFVKEPALVRERADRIFHNTLDADDEQIAAEFFQRLAAIPGASVTALPVPAGEPGLTLRFSTVERFHAADLAQVLAGLTRRMAGGHAFEIYCEGSAEAKRFREILASHELTPGEGAAANLRLRMGPVRRGFDIGELSRTVLTTRELFHRHIVRRVRRKAAAGRAIQSFLELAEGDYIVHLVHGIGRFLGMETFEKDGVAQEFLALEFRDAVKVYVPVSKIDLVQKYIGSGGRAPILDKVGSTSWAKKKSDVEKALLDLASDLLEIQALRQERPGFAFAPDTEWQRELEAAFPFEETPDQTEIAAQIKADMEAPRPMDRLVCGDVGYGKTELAMRAAFKAVQSGKQVAVLVPTTVLAQQHFRTFGERMAEFPVRVGVMSRFRAPAELRATAKLAAQGGVDILIGTHRLLSEDVAFRDLGLVIIDEEQRFGVAHKERLKRLRASVDVLTLTATPIPRTLHLSLLGIRDISSLTTAPEGRVPVKTEVCRFERKLVREILLRELNRDGQVYFVHNRISDLDKVKFDLEEAVPEARVVCAHGQMDEHDLEEIMVRFYEREFDVLISTTIIESGLDIPSVNTIFIDEADRYGLADLHQLRGRVGRGKHQAYCYLLLPSQKHMNPEAQKRVQALVEFTELGAGFQIAMRDLEIRGAGNILGAEQSGNIAAVGYDMYCRLLEKAVRKLRHQPESEPVQVEIELAVDAHVPEGYAGGQAAKIEIYRRLSAAATEAEIADLGAEVADRFGPLPAPVERLFDVQRLRVLSAAHGVGSIRRDDRNLILRGSADMKRILAECPRPVAVLDPRTAAIPVVDPARRYPPPVSDEQVFALALEWFASGRFPEHATSGIVRGAKSGGITAGRR